MILSLDGADNAFFRANSMILKEMVGNLIDNACKWAKRRVDVTVGQVNERRIDNHRG